MAAEPKMRTIIPKEIPVPELHQYLVGSVAPRPIAFASTMSKEGVPNLAPYSFFNCFGSNPPTLIFSSNRRVTGNTTKDTLHNVEATGEVVINVVTHSFIRQMTLASISYPEEVSEFEKSGLTPIESLKVKPYRVKESPVQFECKVKQILPLGEEGGAGNLIICNVELLHINEAVFDEKGKIDPQKMDLMGRMGRAFYVRAHGPNIMKFYQPYNVLGVGFDQLPEKLRHSPVLTGNELAFIAALEMLPSPKECEEEMEDMIVKEIATRFANDPEGLTYNLHQYGRELIQENRVDKAARVLLLPHHKLL